MNKRALEILFATYWSSGGWKDEWKQKVSPEDFAYAKSAGVMFDPIKIGHADALHRLIVARDATDARQVANAFLASLSTRRLDLRSALGSYAIFRHLHDHKPVWLERRCAICGTYLQRAKEDLNVLNFERYKWGGVRHDDPVYAAFDLELFAREEAPTPSREDEVIFANLIAAIDSAPAGTTAATLQRQWVGLFASNKDERDRITAMLGFCGILETLKYPGYRTQFIHNGDREVPNRHFLDMDYPACWWSRAYGLNREALHEWFGHVL
jgi:hypothetical protein